MKKYFSSLVALSVALISYAQHPSVITTGSLNSPRYLHESQVLTDGNVLAFGGDNGYYNAPEIFNSAEIFNPVTNTWVYTGSMNHKRALFASVVLPDGNVMAIGGIDEKFSAQASCEVYNPSSKSWNSISSMLHPRESHEAILLKNGKVLVVGGSLIKTELYDPSSNSWSYTGDLSIAHGKGVSLVMLPDGKILATGGSNPSAANVAEIYDPGTQIWTKVSAPMKRERSYHKSVLLNDGRVLITGTASASYTDQISPEIFNTSFNTFSSPSQMLEGVGRSEMMIMDDGRVLVFGMGDVFSPNDTKCLQVYNPVTDVWTSDKYAFIGVNDSRSRSGLPE